MADKRIKITKTELERVYKELKSQNYSLNDINSKIGAEFRNYLYKGHSLDKQTFDKLQSLCNKEITRTEVLHIDGKKEVETTNHLTRNKETAELIGIMLGDGHLTRKPQHTICITLHEEEEKLIERVKHLIKQTMDKTPKIYPLKGSKAVQLKIYSKEFVDKFIELGLEPGDKVENQVEIPTWIKEEKRYQKSCLRGLVDTDGCIYTQDRDNRTIIRFKNKSKPLLTGFRALCRNLNIRTSDGGGEYSLQVASQDEVSKFVQEIQPLKGRYLQDKNTVHS
ncbi:MAG: LAGLIDADG family homing endonuclease [Candidatus Nanohaloarchaea archaeon]